MMTDFYMNDQTEKYNLDSPCNCLLAPAAWRKLIPFCISINQVTELLTKSQESHLTSSLNNTLNGKTRSGSVGQSTIHKTGIKTFRVCLIETKTHSF